MKLSAFLKRLYRDTSGNTLAIAAAAIIPLTAVIGSALDLSVAYMTRSRLQNACDAGVLAGRQLMQGTTFNQNVEDEATKFFDFNFPEGTSGTTGREFEVAQDQQNQSQLLGSASALVPTSLMKIFGYANIPLEVACDATRDMGHNDIALVLDVTGSMAQAPSGGGASKISRLRTGALGLYRALDSGDGSITRFGIVPYSHTVNVARSLMNRDILVDQTYVDGGASYRICDTNGTYIWNCQDTTSTNAVPWPQTGVQTINGQQKYIYNLTLTGQSTKTVHISNSYWNNANGNYPGNRQGFRTSGDGCIEERPSVGTPTNVFQILNTISQADVDTRAGNGGNQEHLQFGRYDPFVQRGQTQVGCPSEATRLQEYDSESAFETAINAGTARVTGGTYHDVGMLWGVRFLSRSGFFAGNNFNQGDNITEIDGIPVNTHIVFMTDGKLDTDKADGTNDLYSAHGLERFQQRTQGGGAVRDRHIARFAAVCNVAKNMGMTIWVIALDVSDTDDIDDCAISADHFYTSDGTDLEQVFERIGQGIGNLRLTR
jgi:Flp pilus assembly protein TadG